MHSKIQKVIKRLEEISATLYRDHDIDAPTYSRLKGKIMDIDRELLAYDKIYDAKKAVRREHYATG